ncbi:hypothetical protein [Microbacterium sp. CFBP9034]|uniref:hypothetical protein n=1 Tax=Microbacterium sp. CFBP9034 TaxID=3096540 RepID=UPI002A69E389|nr:hypothetical protein [Microbacterium sp. CFBP9034]MDY0909425.1 hypothetical protein [Microbacterium sp. CFBP9034]
MDKQSGRNRSTLRLVLAGIAVVGIGAAITTAAWTDDVFFGATATASSFDLQGRAVLTPADEWQDLGLPGETTAAAPIVLDPAALAALSPGETIDVPFELCNAGTAPGTVSAVTTPVLTGPLATAAGASITLTVTSPSVGTVLPSDASCASPVSGTLQVVTTAAFPPEAQGTSGSIAFTVTGTSD